MIAKTPTIEKVLAEALELHEKGVSLHSIVRTYPEHKAEIEELFSAMATLSLEKEKVRVPAGAFERMLAALPEMEPAAAPVSVRRPLKSPFADMFAGLRGLNMHMQGLKFVLPVMALALLTGGIVLHKGPSGAPMAIAPTADTNATLTPGAQTGTQVAITANQTGSSAATPRTTAPTAPAVATMKAASFAANASTTDRMVASFTQEAEYEATIAKQEDMSTTHAIEADKAAATDPTQ